MKSPSVVSVNQTSTSTQCNILDAQTQQKGIPGLYSVHGTCTNYITGQQDHEDATTQCDAVNQTDKGVQFNYLIPSAGMIIPVSCS